MGINERALAVRSLLEQDGALNANQIRNLQNNLNELGFNAGTADGMMGPNTSRGVIGFLSDPRFENAIDRMSSGMRDSLTRYGFGEKLAELDQAAETRRLLSQGGELSSADLKTLQENLGIEADGLNGPQTRGAIMSHIERNPHLIGSVSGVVMRDLMGFYGLNERLGAVAQSRPEFGARITGLAENENALRSLTKGQLLELQTLLKLGGHDPNGLDGILGPGTRGAFAEFIRDRQSQPAPQQPQTAPAQPPSGSSLVNGTPDRAAEFRHAAHSVTGQGQGPAPTSAVAYGVPESTWNASWASVKGEAAPKYEANLGASNPRPVIVLDLGHGADIGNDGSIDPGGEYNGFTELTIVDPLGAELARQLHDLGYDVVLTRGPGQELPLSGTKGRTLEARSEFADKIADMHGANGVVFISLHADKAEGFPNNRKDDAYIQPSEGPLGRALAKAISGDFHMGEPDTDVQTRNLAVTRRFNQLVDTSAGNPNASLLFEIGKMTNDEDRAAMLDIAADPTEAARTIANSIDRVLREHIPSIPEPVEEVPGGGVMAEKPGGGDFGFRNS